MNTTATVDTGSAAAASLQQFFGGSTGGGAHSWEALTGSVACAHEALLTAGRTHAGMLLGNSAATGRGHVVQSGDTVPPSLFYSYPVCRGTTPPPRWAHTMCSAGSTLIVFGGIGHAVQGDLWSLDTATMTWRSLAPRCASPKDQPVKMLGHAAAVSSNQMFIFGGQQGRTLLRKMYCLDLEQMVWRRISNESLPSARAGHAMVTAGNDIYLFGGHGKKLLNDLYKLDVRTGEFMEVVAGGRPPLPRRGMSLVHDGKDSLVCFGGTHAHGIDAALSVYSLSRREWFHPQQNGPVPQARTNHSAVLLSPYLILVWGGCTREATFLGDATVLDTRTFTWHRPQLLNAAPAPRYHHTCCAVNGRAFLYGGINGASKTFDGIAVLDTRFAPDISHIAEELQALATLSTSSSTAGGTGNGASGGLSGPDRSALSVGSSAAGTADCPSAACEPSPNKNVDLMKVQLMDLLYKRNMEELHAQASHKAETTEALLAKERESLEALRRDHMQLRIMCAEAEAATAAAKEQARVAESRAARAVHTIAELQSAHASALARVSELEAETESSRRRHQALVKELGAIASRFAKLQQQSRTKRKPLNHSESTTRERERERSTRERSTSQPHGVDTPSSLLNSCASDMAGPAVHRQSHPDGSSSSAALLRVPLSMCWPPADDCDNDAVSEAGDTSARTSQLSVETRTPSLQAFSVGGASFSGRRRANANLNRTSCRTEGASPRVSDYAAAAAAVLARVNAGNGEPSDSVLLGSIDDILSQLAEAEQQKQELEEKCAALKEQLEAGSEARRQAETQVRALRGEPEALTCMGLSELTSLERQLEDALRATRETALKRRMVEVQRRAASEHQCCSLCLERPRGVVFNCGHQACDTCSQVMAAETCPFCRTPVTARIKLFDT